MHTHDAIDAFMRSRHARRLSPHTIAGYEWALGKVEEMYPDELPSGARDIEVLFLEGMADASAASLVGCWRKLKTFWSWLAAQEMAADIMANVPRPRAPRRFPQTLNTIEIGRLLSSALSERDYTLISAFLDTGMRVSEMASINRRDIDVEHESIRIDGKAGERFVPVSPIIADLMVSQSVEDDVWTGIKGRLTRWGLQGAVRRCMKRAGFDRRKIGPHTLRHSFAHQYILNGGDCFSLRDILGHSKVETTMIYVSMSVGTLIEQHHRYSPMARMIERGEYATGMDIVRNRVQDLSVFVKAGQKSGRVRRAKAKR